MKTIHIVSFSPCGGTAEVNRVLALSIDLPLIEHDWTTPDKRMEKLSFSPEDLVFLAFPVYGGRMPRNIEEVFVNLEGKKTPCALIAVYGNREYEGAFIDLYAAAKSKNFIPVAAVAAIAEHSLAPMVAKGRPDHADRITLADFGLKIFKKAQTSHILKNAPGEMPTWKVPEGANFFPITDKAKCVSCGMCVSVCPAGAISRDSPDKTDITKCIMCAACAKNCPQTAREMGNAETRELFKPHLLTAASRRKEPELFF